MVVEQVRKIVLLLLLVVAVVLFSAPVASAQGPTPTPPPRATNPPPANSNNSLDAVSMFFNVGRLTLDTLQGRKTPDANFLFEQSQRSMTDLLNNRNADFFFFDFGDPNLPLNQFAAQVAQALLLLTPLYVVGYLVILVYNVWRERSIPNPILYLGLVIAVMIFLASFAVITQGMSQVGRAIVLAFGSAGDPTIARATLLSTIIQILIVLQNKGGILSIIGLLVALVEMAIILIQLAYRGISMAIWRLLGVLVIPISVLLEGVQPKTAGRVIAGFFEAWLDMVGKLTLLLIVLSIASANQFADSAWFILPAGLVVVVVSWKFFGILYNLLRDFFARMWTGFVPAMATESDAPLPPSAEAARVREIDEERRRALKE